LWCLLYVVVHYIHNLAYANANFLFLLLFLFLLTVAGDQFNEWIRRLFEEEEAA
jgi:predicted PurR-regulated permease PerM